jgi:glycosyltransferase involved in cell wall biosynthesis
MKIMLVTPSMEVGGNERIVIALVRGLAARGHQVALFGPAGALEPEIAGIDIARVALDERGRSRLGAIWAAARLATFVARWRPDVVHAINPKMTGIAAAATRAVSLRRPGLISTFGNCPPADLPAAARILNRSDAACPVSSELGADLVAAGLDGARLRVVPPGVTIRKRAGGNRYAALDAELGLDASPVVLAVGRLVEQKNHLRLLEAAAIVVRDDARIRFLIAGDGPLRRALEVRADELGLGGSLTLLGNREDVPALAGRADVVAFSSDWEGLSVAALEALAVGTPVVTTPAEGMRELLGGGAGCVVSGFGASELASGILELLRDEPRRREMGLRGTALVASRYSLDAMLEAYTELYRDIARPPATPRRGPAASTH